MTEPTFRPDDLQLVTVDHGIIVIGQQVLTSNAIEDAAEPGQRPIARGVPRVHEPQVFAPIAGHHTSGNMVAISTEITTLAAADPASASTMGRQVPDDDGEIPAGPVLTLRLADATPASIPAAWRWLLHLFATQQLPWDRSFAGDVEIYHVDPATQALGITISVGVRGSSEG